MTSLPVIVSVYHGPKRIADKPKIFSLLTRFCNQGCRCLAIELTEYPFRGVNDFSRIADRAKKIGFDICAIDSPDADRAMQRLSRQKVPFAERLVKGAYISIVRERHMARMLRANPADVILVQQVHAAEIARQIPGRVIQITPASKQNKGAVALIKQVKAMRKAILEAERAISAQKSRSLKDQERAENKHDFLGIRYFKIFNSRAFCRGVPFLLRASTSAFLKNILVNFESAEPKYAYNVLSGRFIALLTASSKRALSNSFKSL